MYASKNIKGKKKSSELSQMIWGYFISNKLDPLVFIDETINKEIYIQLLEQNLLPFIDLLHENDIHNIVFQQDSASSHSSPVTQEWLKAAIQQHRFILMDFPPNSPDLNPIEHLWFKVKAELYRRYPDIIYLKGSGKAVRKELQNRLNKIWWDIGEDILNKLIDNMPKRIETVLKVKGWYTEY